MEQDNTAILNRTLTAWQLTKADDTFMYMYSWLKKIDE